ncbi:accessory gland protein Acp29AB-like [Drosophila sulfurigaster albostrigata]|uniref:accessory gland protein Acp29AB-like n=1 Tax=Drosophila sulfurigaster albostrigata TaxID=89887 RepID=UPI002D21C287|nr:accessory gland protein Acp29AB-like [Drosophila sulfurigaster albostrigata]
MLFLLRAIVVLALLHSFGHTQNADDQLVIKENPCDSYCFNVLKPMLEHISIMQNRWEECGAMKSVNASDRLDKIEQQLLAQQAIQATNAAAIQENKHNLTDQMKSIEKYKRELRKPFEKIGSGYYYIENAMKLSWFAAVHTCHRYGAHLLELNNREELDALIPKLHKDYAYWIDINDLSHENEFLSMTTGLGAEFLNWRTGEPNNAQQLEHCVNMFGIGFQMNDFKCGAETYFICESFEE